MSDPAPAPITRHEAGLLCPACRVDLVMADRQGIEIDYCPRCRGVWLDRGELDKIIERTAAYEAAPQAPPPEPPLARPGYGQPWDGGYSGEHGGGRRGAGPHGGGGHHGGGHGRRRGFLGGLFDD
ncbi:zf-TFIIB domain-containing protein [Phenylobacterium sp. SCN 70-31]|uniref:TFIIB-type zinc ribbon-containing protein n=1 Tax=Phenylobacterium sp. SCN 70-31 TaxID=1660129 RepID=UPI0025E993F0|nr:zf-TFIIB domain-containing protein [Phenylobacterium sp. SCN 70-31]